MLLYDNYIIIFCTWTDSWFEPIYLIEQPNFPSEQQRPLSTDEALLGANRSMRQKKKKREKRTVSCRRRFVVNAKIIGLFSLCVLQ